MTDVTVTQADESRALEIFNEALGDMYSFAEYGRPSYQDGALRTITFHCARHRQAALADAQVEPVAWMYKIPGTDARSIGFYRGAPQLDGWVEVPLYTHQPAQDVAALVSALERLASTMDSYTRIGVTEYYRKLHAGYWRDEVLRISTALASFRSKP